MNTQSIIRKLLTKKRIWGSSKTNKEFDSKYQIIDKDEQSAINDVWKLKVGGDTYLPVPLKGYRIYKTLEGFNPLYCTEDLFPHYIVRSLNEPIHVLTLEHKAMYNMVFPELHKPKTIFSSIKGILFDDSMSVLDLSHCYSKMKEYESVCIKLTTFSACGQGVRKLNSNISFGEFEKILKNFGEDFIVQGVLSQSDKTKRLSNNSLNTFRISSLFINGKVSICSIINRVGRGDSFVDNGLAGNLVVGVNMDGKYRNYAYDKDYNRYYKTDTGLKFADLQLDEVKELVDIVIDAHPRYLPQCGFCGWDFALDADDKWTLIEVNLYAPGIEMEQICPAVPLFGDRTAEVIDYVNNHQPSTNAILTTMAFVNKKPLL